MDSCDEQYSHQYFVVLPALDACFVVLHECFVVLHEFFVVLPVLKPLGRIESFRLFMLGMLELDV